MFFKYTIQRKLSSLVDKNCFIHWCAVKHIFECECMYTGYTELPCQFICNIPMPLSHWSHYHFGTLGMHFGNLGICLSLLAIIWEFNESQLSRLEVTSEPNSYVLLDWMACCVLQASGILPENYLITPLESWNRHYTCVILISRPFSLILSYWFPFEAGSWIRLGYGIHYT